MKRQQPHSPAPVQRKALATDYDTVLSEMVELLENARRTAARAVNSVMSATYWEVGRRIVEIEQQGRPRKDYYGEETVDRLSAGSYAALWPRLWSAQSFSDEGPKSEGTRGQLWLFCTTTKIERFPVGQPPWLSGFARLR